MPVSPHSALIWWLVPPCKNTLAVLLLDRRQEVSSRMLRNEQNWHSHARAER
jgi:hypothetical protein